MKKNSNHIGSKSYNKYDVMIFVIILSMATGYFGGYFYPARIVVLLFLPFLVDCLNGKTLAYISPLFYVFMFWGFYCFLSIFWAPKTNLAIYHFFLMLINFVMFLEITVFSRNALSPYNNIATSWLIAFFLTSFVAFWELQTGNHLSNAKDDYLGREDAMSDLAFGTYTAVGFYNLNTYCLYILQVFPFALYILANKMRVRLIVLAIYSLFAGLVFILANGSRGSLIGLAIMFFIFTVRMIKGNSRTFGIALVLVISVIYLFVEYGDSLLSVIIYRMQYSGLFEDNSRIVLAEKSMELFLNSYGLGTGVGSMVPAMAKQGNFYGIFYTHNLFIEILMQFGVVIFLFFCYFIYFLYDKAREIDFQPNKILLYSGLFSLPFYSVVNSEYTHLHFVWCYFACLYIYTQTRRNTSIRLINDK